MKHWIKLAVFLMVPLNAFAGESHQHLEQYSCNLIQYSGICREYSIAPHDEATSANLKEGCETMQSASFKKQRCPIQEKSASCVNIVRDHHHPDLLYDNHYYKKFNTRWTNEEVTRVCRDLGGIFKH